MNTDRPTVYGLEHTRRQIVDRIAHERDRLEYVPPRRAPRAVAEVILFRGPEDFDPPDDREAA